MLTDRPDMPVIAISTVSGGQFTGDTTAPLKGQVIYRDDTLIGFGLRVTASCKAYIAECRVNGTTRRVTLGRQGSISADDARMQAAKLIKKMSAKRLPSKRSTQAPSLGELLDLYISRKQLCPSEFRSGTNFTALMVS